MIIQPPYYVPTSLPDKFNCMKKVAIGSQAYSRYSEGCVRHKVPRFSPEISTLVKGKQGTRIASVWYEKNVTGNTECTKTIIYVKQMQEDTFYFNYNGHYILYHYGFNFHRLYIAENAGTLCSKGC